MVKYTTAAIVKDRLGERGPMSDAEIEEIIDQVEAMIDTIVKVPSTFTFTAATTGHRLLRKAATSGAALMVLAAGPMSQNTLDQVAFMADVLKDEWDTCLGILNQSEAFDFIEG